MKNLLSLLERFSESLHKDVRIKERIVSVVHEKTRIRLPEESISFKEGVLEIRTSPLVTSEILLKQEVVINELKERYNVRVSRILFK